MNRPVYETDYDRHNEAEVAAHISLNTKLRLRKNASKSVFDYVGMTDKGTYNVEIKCRNNVWGKYPTVLLSAMKFATAMKDMTFSKNIGLTFFVQTKDKLMCYMAHKKDLPKIRNEWGGRADRGDAADMEWVVHIPIELFKEVRVREDSKPAEAKEAGSAKDTEGSRREGVHS